MQASTAIQISIHAPLAGNDYTIPQIVALCRISIHAPLAGNDDLMSNIRKEERNFNPRPPCGERLAGEVRGVAVSEFQSTLPLRGTTRVNAGVSLSCQISIHAPLAGNDSACWI